MASATLKVAALFALLALACAAKVSPSPAANSTADKAGNTTAESTMGPEPSQEPVCFPAAGTVQTPAGSKRMDELAIGDSVAVGNGIFSEVFMFTHKLVDAAHNFVQLSTASGATIRLTAGHFLPINGAHVPASSAKIGDAVELADGSASRIVAVNVVADVGLFNPQTAHGAIVVDGVRASTYTTAVAPSAAHAMLTPLRAAFGRLGFATSAFNKGAAALAAIAPKA